MELRRKQERTHSPETLHRSETLLVDQGELDDVYEMLQALGADPARRQAFGAEDLRDWEETLRLVVVSAGAATRLNEATGINAPGVVTIAVAEADSQTLCGILLRQGFDYVVRRPVHPEALRLLLLRALYRGSERRSEPRLPFGYAVTTRWGMRWHPATLLDISGHGCRLLGPEILEKGTRVRVRIPGDVSGGHGLKLRGYVRRSELAQGESSNTNAVMALAFDPLSRRTRKRLEALLAATVIGPPALPRAGGKASRATPASPPATGVDDPTGATQGSRRRHQRATFEQEVVVLDTGSERVRQVLFARNLSVGGVRVDPHPDLQLGDRFKLALYHASFSDSVVVDAEVLRDDGERGIALRFVDPPKKTARQLGRIVERGGEIERSEASGEAHDVTVAEVLQEDRA